MKKAYLYCDKRSLNDATIFYIDLVNDCLRIKGYDIFIVHQLDEIKKPTLIFTITNYYFVKAKLRFPFIKTINWSQGVEFEEVKMTRAYWKRFPFWLFEQFTIWFSDMHLFVSDKMCEYYRNYFLYRGNGHVIMPCYNLPLGKFSSVERFSSPSFVYAGGVSKWQGIDTLLDTYAKVEAQIPTSSLTMYCKENDYIYGEAQKRNINNIKVKYVSLDELQGELCQYKYGFILREKNWVNYVATPTKMNSYLAAYLIPIFSDGVDDFSLNINLGEFTIMAKTPLNPNAIAEQIVSFEKGEHCYEDYKSIVEGVFSRHYNDEHYKCQILKKLSELNM